MIKKSSRNNKNIILILTLLIILVTIFAPKIIDLTGKATFSNENAIQVDCTNKGGVLEPKGRVTGDEYCNSIQKTCLETYWLYDLAGNSYYTPEGCDSTRSGYAGEVCCDGGIAITRGDTTDTPTPTSTVSPIVVQQCTAEAEETYKICLTTCSFSMNPSLCKATCPSLKDQAYDNCISSKTRGDTTDTSITVVQYTCTPSCTAPTPFCDRGTCVECTSNTHCAADEICDAGVCVPKTPSTAIVTIPCTPSCAAPTPICDRGNCVECTSNTHCADDEVCTTKTCVSTTPSTAYVKFTCDPICVAPTPACYKYNTCVECRLDAHCVGDKVCNTNTNTCVDPPVCGNDIRETGEECDGGTGCTNCICNTGYQSTTPVSINCRLTTIITGAACTPGKRLDVNNDGTSDNYCDSNANSVALLPDQDQCDASYKCQSNICAPNNKCLSYNYLKELYCSIKENILDETTDSDYQTHCT